VSNFIQAGGSIIQGNAAYAAGKFNNQVAQRNAQQTEAEAASEGERVRADARATMGEAIAMQGGSGVQLGTGSALASLRESAINGELDVLTLRRKGTLAANNQRVSGSMALMEGKAARTAGYLSAAASIAKNFEKAAPGGAG
jgi:hypothetical protein